MESASGKTENGDSSESAATVTLNDDYRLGKQVLSFPTTKNMEDIVLHLRDTFVKLNDKKRNTVLFNSSGISIVVLFFLISLYHWMP